MLIRMITSIPGSYDNGQPWPPAGGVIDVPHDVGRDLILGGHAVDAHTPPPPVPAPPPPPAPALAPMVVSQPAATAAGPLPSPPEPEPDPEPPSAPGPADPKAEWIGYAISRGADPDTAGRMTKADLMSRYGGRL